MDYKEVFLIFRLPVPLYILHVTSLLEECEEDPVEFLSFIVSEIIAKRYSDEDVYKAFKEKLLPLIPHEPREAMEGVNYLSNFIKYELQQALPRANMKQFQCVGFSKHDSVTVSFFSKGDEHLSWQRLY